MDTPQEIILAAYGYSKHNTRGKIASEEGELLPLVNRRMAAYFAEAARENQAVFAIRHTKAYSGDVSGWPRPLELESVIGAEFDDGETITIVAWDQRHIEPSKPCIYALGQVYYPAGGDNDPTSDDDIVFVGPKVAAVVEALDDSLDALWPRQFSTLIALDVALYLARKDGRQNELDALKAERDDWHARWLLWLGHENAAAAQAHTTQRRANPPGVQVR